MVVYWPALRGTFVWDDTKHVTNRELQSLHGLWRIWSDLSATQQYYPVLHSAFWLEHRVWGNAVIGYHSVNMVLHALSACLLVLIAKKLGLPGAWLAGWIFALHPIYVEGVAWIAEQKSTLSGAFCLASLLVYLHFDQSRRRRSYLLALALFILAFLSKSVTATLPAALLVILWWKHGRLEWKRDLRPLVPWFALAIPMGLFTARVERTYVGATGSEFNLTLVQRVLLAGRLIWFYAAKLVWPFNLIFQYLRWTLDPAAWWQWLYPAGVLVTAGVLLLAARRNRGPLAGFLIFAGTLFPVLGFLNVLPFRYSWAADHFQYLASLGLLVPLSAWLTVAAGRALPGRFAHLAIAGCVLILLGTLTWRQSDMYRDDEALYRDTLARNPSSWLAHNNLGSLLMSKPGGAGEAVTQYQAAVDLAPGYPMHHLNLGNALAAVGDPGQTERAIAEYQAALRLQPDYADAHYDLVGCFPRCPAGCRKRSSITVRRCGSSRAWRRRTPTWGCYFRKCPGTFPRPLRSSAPRSASIPAVRNCTVIWAWHWRKPGRLLPLSRSSTRHCRSLPIWRKRIFCWVRPYRECPAGRRTRLPNARPHYGSIPNSGRRGNCSRSWTANNSAINGG